MVIDAYLYIAKKLNEQNYSPKMFERSPAGRPVKTVQPIVTLSSSSSTTVTNCNIPKSSSSSVTPSSTPNIAMISPIAVIEQPHRPIKIEPDVPELLEMEKSQIKQEKLGDDELQIIDHYSPPPPKLGCSAR